MNLRFINKLKGIKFLWNVFGVKWKNIYKHKNVVYTKMKICEN